MPKSTLDRLAEAHGVALSYVDETGKMQIVDDSTKRGILAALGVATDGATAIEAPPQSRSRSLAAEQPADGSRGTRLHARMA